MRRTPVRSEAVNEKTPSIEGVFSFSGINFGVAQTTDWGIRADDSSR
jgi:hypothetical protein